MLIKRYKRQIRPTRDVLADNMNRLLAPLTKKYGSHTAEDRAALYELQTGRCAVCNKEITEANSQVDHDHNTGFIRGLLCRNCNGGLGCFKDNIYLLTHALAYVIEARDRVARPNRRFMRLLTRRQRRPVREKGALVIFAQSHPEGFSCAGIIAATGFPKRSLERWLRKQTELGCLVRTKKGWYEPHF